MVDKFAVYVEEVEEHVADGAARDQLFALGFLEEAAAIEGRCRR